MRNLATGLFWGAIIALPMILILVIGLQVTGQ